MLLFACCFVCAWNSVRLLKTQIETKKPKNVVLRKMFKSTGRKFQEDGEKCLLRYLGWPHQKGWDVRRWGMQGVEEKCVQEFDEIKQIAGQYKMGS